MTATKPLRLVCIFVVLLISSCNSHKSGKPKTHVVEIKEMSFVPEKLTVSHGDTIKWINKDLVAHNVKSKHWKSPKLEQGEEFTIKISRKTEYKCTLHPVMEGELLINTQK